MVLNSKIYISLWAISGLATLAVVVMPSIVFLGFILLIIPGLVLSIMPVYFTYSTAYFITKQAVSFIATRCELLLSDVGIRCMAFAVVGLVSVAIPALTYIHAKDRLRFSSLPDIVPSKSIKLFGDVRIEGSDLDNVHARARKILQISEVTSVTISISPNEGYEDLNALKNGATNSKPMRLANLRELPQLGRTYRLNKLANCRRFGNDMSEADAKICMVESNQVARYDFLLRDGSWMEYLYSSAYWDINWPVRIEYAEVRSRDKILARKWMAHTLTLGIPIRAFPSCGSTYETKLCWSRKRLGNYANGDWPRVDKFVQALQQKRP